MENLKVEVKTLFNGMASIGNKYYNEAKAKQIPLEIIYKKKSMTILPSELDSKIKICHPNQLYNDKITGRPYFLIYY
jgi:hypothetical protein